MELEALLRRQAAAAATVSPWVPPARRQPVIARHRCPRLTGPPRGLSVVAIILPQGGALDFEAAWGSFTRALRAEGQIAASPMARMHASSVSLAPPELHSA